MRALPLLLLLAGCAAGPLAPLPDAGRAGFEPCHGITPVDFMAAPGMATGAGAIGDVAVSAKGSEVSCRVLGDGSTACDVRGEAYVRAGGGFEAQHYHVPAGRMGTVTRVNGALMCRMAPA